MWSEVDVATVLGGPMVWACRASQYLRPSEVDDDDFDKGPPFWRGVRDVDGDLEAYLRSLEVDYLPASPVDALEILARAHEAKVVIGEQQTTTTDARASLDRIKKSLPVSGADANVLFGWCCLRLSHIFCDTKFCLARQRRRDNATILPKRHVRQDQSGDWGPACHVVVLISATPTQRFIVDLSLPGLTPVSVACPSEKNIRLQKRDSSLFSSSSSSLYSIDERQHDSWLPLVLFDARTNRPHSHFIPGNNKGGQEFY